MSFAEKTRVPVSQSRGEIERLVLKHKCAQFMSGTDYDNGLVRVQFKAHDRFVRFTIHLPKKATLGDRKDQERYEQEERQLWRRLLLVVKAKLESVESGITTFEQEFLAHIVMPNDRTVFELIVRQIESAYSTGTMPKLLTAPEDESR